MSWLIIFALPTNFNWNLDFFHCSFCMAHLAQKYQTQSHTYIQKPSHHYCMGCCCFFLCEYLLNKMYTFTSIEIKVWTACCGVCNHDPTTHIHSNLLFVNILDTNIYSKHNYLFYVLYSVVQCCTAHCAVSSQS